MADPKDVDTKLCGGVLYLGDRTATAAYSAEVEATIRKLIANFNTKTLETDVAAELAEHLAGETLT